MSEMIERVARAIYAEFENRPLYAQAQMNGVFAEELARAAIEAMREPTEAMISAAWTAPLAPGKLDGYPIYDNMSAPSRGEVQAWGDVMGPLQPGGYGARQYSDWERRVLEVAYGAMITAALADAAKPSPRPTEGDKSRDELPPTI